MNQTCHLISSFKKQEIEQKSKMETQIDTIAERVINIEKATNSLLVKKLINEAIKSIAKREIFTRSNTVTISIDTENTADITKEQLLKNFISQLPFQIWQDKNNIYVRFSIEEDKEKFYHQILMPSNPVLYDKIYNRTLKECDGGLKPLIRRPVKLEMLAVKEAIKIDDIRKMFEKIGQQAFTNLKEGKPIANSKTRVVSIRANAFGFEKLFKNLDGKVMLPNGIVYPRINVRPYVCRDCSSLLPQHKNNGKVCNNCGNNNHRAVDCGSKTRFCGNCKTVGQRAKDLSCPKYIQELIKEVQKCDIPIEFMEDEYLRAILVRNMNLK